MEFENKFQTIWLQYSFTEMVWVMSVFTVAM